MPPEGLKCPKCGHAIDVWGNHAETCATSEATNGHYAVVRVLHQACLATDPGAVMEARGLTSDGTRPADVLSAAVSGGSRKAATDTTVVSEAAHCA